MQTTATLLSAPRVRDARQLGRGRRRSVLLEASAEVATTDRKGASGQVLEKLRGELPLLTSKHLVSPEIKYALSSVEGSACTGLEAYLARMESLRAAIPVELGTEFKFETQSLQTDSNTLRVRWTASWLQVRSGSAEAAFLESTPSAEVTLGNKELPEGLAEPRLLFDSMGGELSVAEQKLRDAAAALGGGTSGNPAADVEAALAAVVASRTKLAALEKSPPLAGGPRPRSAAARWRAHDGAGPGKLDLLADLAQEITAEMGAEQAARMRRQLMVRCRGATTLKLDDAGLLCAREDSLDWVGRGLEESLAAAGASAEGEEDGPFLTGADGAYLFALALRPQQEPSWRWQFQITRQQMWEAFQVAVESQEGLGEEPELSRAEFDQIIAGVLAAAALLAAAAAVYLPYWLLVALPQVPSQLEDLQLLSSATGVAAAVKAAAGDAVDASQGMFVANIEQGPPLWQLLLQSMLVHGVHN